MCFCAAVPSHQSVSSSLLLIICMFRRRRLKLPAGRQRGWFPVEVQLSSRHQSTFDLEVFYCWNRGKIRQEPPAKVQNWPESSQTAESVAHVVICQPGDEKSGWTSAAVYFILFRRYFKLSRRPIIHYYYYHSSIYIQNIIPLPLHHSQSSLICKRHIITHQIRHKSSFYILSGRLKMMNYQRLVPPLQMNEWWLCCTLAGGLSL